MSSVSEIQRSLRSPEKIREASKAVFEQVDADGSGKIDKVELKRAMIMVTQHAGIPAPDDADVEAAMKALDSDCN